MAQRPKRNSAIQTTKFDKSSLLIETEDTDSNKVKIIERSAEDLESEKQKTKKIKNTLSDNYQTGMKDFKITLEEYL